MQQTMWFTGLKCQQPYLENLLGQTIESQCPIKAILTSTSLYKRKISLYFFSFFLFNFRIGFLCLNGHESFLLRESRSSSLTNVTLFFTKTLKTTTYKRSFFSRKNENMERSKWWNGFPVPFSISLMKAHLLSYYKQSLCQAYDPGVTRLFKPICTSCIKLVNG